MKPGIERNNPKLAKFKMLKNCQKKKLAPNYIMHIFNISVTCSQTIERLSFKL